jgi:hypothetical protein
MANLNESALNIMAYVVDTHEQRMSMNSTTAQDYDVDYSPTDNVTDACNHLDGESSDLLLGIRYF